VLLVHDRAPEHVVWRSTWNDQTRL
jgi:hypothetical protein